MVILVKQGITITTKSARENIHVNCFQTSHLIMVFLTASHLKSHGLIQLV